MPELKGPVSSEPSASRSRTYTRRGVIALGGAVGVGLVSAAIVSDNRTLPTPKTSPHAAAPEPKTRTFASTPLTAPQLITEQSGETADGLIFIQPQKGFFNGLIVDNSGEPTWIAPLDLNMTDLRVQQFEGAPVLTYWSGTSTTGHGLGIGTILDSSYNLVAHVQTGPGMVADLHEFELTDSNTALMTAFPTTTADLSSLGGPVEGYVLNCHIQEVDVRSGAVLFDWNALDHIPLAETFATVRNPADGFGASVATAFDAYHLNSIAYDATTFYISSRHTHAVYAVSRSTGAILWRMGGKSSDFDIADDATFAWQHHIRKHPNGMYSLFNNKSRTRRSDVDSAGLLLNVDEIARTVTLQQKYSVPGVLSIAEGSTLLLENGNVMVGWGTAPRVTEFTADGEPVFSMTSVGTGSYRAFRGEWTGRPSTAPDVAVVPSSGTVTVYASWNGATEVTDWRILTGSSARSLSAVLVVARSGFETKATVPRAPTVMVEALDFLGNVLGASRTVSL